MLKKTMIVLFDYAVLAYQARTAKTMTEYPLFPKKCLKSGERGILGKCNCDMF